MKSDKVSYIIGKEPVVVRPIEPYSDIVCDFLDVLSKKLMADKVAKTYSDIVSLAFWCRKSNITKLKCNFTDDNIRIGRGVIFHITPSNVPVNFAFSYFFGLLSGNANIVRIPSKPFNQVEIICKAIKELLEQKEYEQIKNMTSFISYSKDDEVTSYFSSICDARIIWGGDEAIKNIRKFSIKERCVEIVFPDRYSICFIDSESIVNLSDKELESLGEKFYNDTYLMDQNACSTPHLICWFGDNDLRKKEAKDRFWNSIYKISKKYDLTQIKAVDKYTQLCNIAIRSANIKEIDKYDNLLYVIDIINLPDDINNLRGKFGVFYQYNVERLEHLAKYVDSKMQTVTYFGMNKDKLVEFILNNNLQGIDRIVPIGSALDIGVIWDGYDIIGSLSRIIYIN